MEPNNNTNYEALLSQLQEQIAKTKVSVKENGFLGSLTNLVDRNRYNLQGMLDRLMALKKEGKIVTEDEIKKAADLLELVKKEELKKSYRQSKTKFILIAAGVLLAAGGVYYYYKTRKK